MKYNKKLQNYVFRRKYLKTSKIEVVGIFPSNSKKYKNRNERRRYGKDNES